MRSDDASLRRIETLRAIMATLRTPGSGCPWDLEQSYETIAPYTIEEAYEVADAVERGNRADLCEELGDLLLQVVYHARLAEEEGAFALEDVIEAITEKMLRRHPHVFGDEEARSIGVAPGFWEATKARERAAKPAGSGTLDGIPTALPALTRARKLQARAARVGFDWPQSSAVLDKIVEEADEVHAAWKAGKIEQVAEETGDLLFAVVNLARHMGIDAETALRHANAKFERRFARVETVLAEDGKQPGEASLTELDALWDAAKRVEKGED